MSLLFNIHMHAKHISSSSLIKIDDKKEFEVE
jgi:hypothetical protein